MAAAGNMKEILLQVVARPRVQNNQIHSSTKLKADKFHPDNDLLERKAPAWLYFYETLLLLMQQ